MHEVDALLVGVAGEAEGVRDGARLEALHAEDRVDRLAVNRLRIARGDLLDLHAALLRRHHDWHADAAVERDAEVQLAIDVERLFDEHLPHLAAFGAGLVRDEGHPDHLLGQVGCFVRVLRELDAAAFAAAAGVDLRLDDHASAELFRGRARVLRRVDDDAARRRDSVPPQDLFCLIFVDLHRAASCITSPEAQP